jgi:hypothetical protein
VDPVGVRSVGDNFHRYWYANSNPYRYVDPDGRETAMFQRKEYRMPAPDAATGKAALGLIADFTPGVGDARGIYEAVQSPSVPNVLSAGVSLVPGVGDVAGKLIKGAGNIADASRSAGNGPDFVVTPGGTAFPVPSGATGPTPSINPAGKVTGAAFTGGSGGANGQVASMRIMDANAKNPAGYIKYENGARPKPQGVDPYTGRTVSPDAAHHPIDR